MRFTTDLREKPNAECPRLGINFFNELLPRSIAAHRRVFPPIYIGTE